MKEPLKVCSRVTILINLTFILLKCLKGFLFIFILLIDVCLHVCLGEGTVSPGTGLSCEL